MNDTSFIVDTETMWGYYPEWAQGLIAFASIVLVFGLLRWIGEIILKAKTKKASKRAMDLVRKRGIENVNPTVGLVALRNDIMEKIKQCKAAEEEFRKMLAEIDEEMGIK